MVRVWNKTGYFYMTQFHKICGVHNCNAMTFLNIIFNYTLQVYKAISYKISKK